MKANKSKFRRFASRISTVLLTGLAVAAMPKRSEGQCIPVSAYFPVLTCVPVFQPDIPTPSSGTYDYYYEFEGVLMPVPDTPEWWFFEKDCYTAEVVTQGATTISNRAHWGYQLSEIYADSSGCYDIGNHTFAYTIGETGDVTREETSSDAANAGATLVLNKTTTVGDFTYTLQVWEHVSDSGDPYDFHFFSRTVRYTIVGDDYSSVPSTPSGYGIHEILTPTMTPLGESTITVVPTFSNAHFNGSDEFEFTIFGEEGEDYDIYRSTDPESWSSATKVADLNNISSYLSSSTIGYATWSDASSTNSVPEYYYKVVPSGSPEDCTQEMVGFLRVDVSDDETYTSLANPFVTTYNTVSDLKMDTFPENIILKWDIEGQTYQSSTWAFGSWTDPNMILDTGEGFFIAPDSDFTITFFGAVQSGRTINLPEEDYVFLGAGAPFGASLSPDYLGMAPETGDIIQTWDYENQDWDIHTWTGSSWSGGTPNVGEAEGFFYLSGEDALWAQSILVSDCP